MQKIYNLLTNIATVLLSMILGFPISVGAQQSGVALEEIVVTAQRREQNLQDVPISINLFTGLEIQKENFRNLEELTSFSPGVILEEGDQQGSATFYLNSVLAQEWDMEAVAGPGTEAHLETLRRRIAEWESAAAGIRGGKQITAELITRPGSNAPPIPAYVTREIADYGKCGHPEHSFLWVQSDSCHQEKLMAFSAHR